ncbi:hypothetical protein, partial [Lysinibacillus sp. D4B2_S17]|uniref:hypothetical protein n=1 Tax=Lysinibacillus sp. D4B2_S17 TaxID=2941225 RepID=UPI0020BEEF45
RKQEKWWQRSFDLMLSLVLVISSFLAGGTPVSYAADGETPLGIYVSSGGDNTTGDGTEGNPYATLKKAFDEIKA